MTRVHEPRKSKDAIQTVGSCHGSKNVTSAEGGGRTLSSSRPLCNFRSEKMEQDCERKPCKGGVTKAKEKASLPLLTCQGHAHLSLGLGTQIRKSAFLRLCSIFCRPLNGPSAARPVYKSLKFHLSRGRKLGRHLLTIKGTY